MSQTMKQIRQEFDAHTVSGVSPLLLGNCPQISDLSTTALLRLSESAECRLVHEGESLFRQAERADSAYLLLDGTIRLDRFEQTGEKTSYDVVAPYATFGDVVLLGEEMRRYTATAEQNSVVVELPLRPLLEELRRNPPQALAWRSAIMARLHRKEPAQAMTFGWRLLGKLSEIFEAA